MPASTVIGAASPGQAALVAGLLAIEPKAAGILATAVPSPLQEAPISYGSAFSRAVEIDFGDHRRQHAGRDCNESWIHSIARGLRPGGIGLISATFNMRARPTNYCTIKHIFPGGFIPTLAQTLLLMEKHGLNLISIENLTYHYHRTVQQWLKNFETHWERIRAIDPARFSESFRRSWLFYLGGAAETFEAAREIINCYHVTFVKGHSADPVPR